MYRQRNKVFISYSHQDAKWLESLLKMLKPLTRNDSLTVWTDKNISAGAKWVGEIARALASAKIAVLLVSPDFLASDFIAKNELPPLLTAAEREGLTIIWIPISHCLYRDSPVSEYQAAHDPARPLDSLSTSDRNRALTRIAEIIKLASGSHIDTSQSDPPVGRSHLGRLTGATTIQISISQLFRLIDLLTLPGSVRARQLHGVFTEASKMRRALNARRSFPVQGLGSLQPVVAIADQTDDFWRVAVPDFRLAKEREIWFIPFDLKLTERLAELEGIPGSPIEEILAQCGPLIKNRQITGRLRIYPPGVGVLRIMITLTFMEAIDADAVARIAHGIEELLFVDANGLERPCHELLLSIVQQVSDYLFRNDGLSYEERRWLPPEIIYSLRDDTGLEPEKQTDLLAQLMYLAPGNEEPRSVLEDRVRDAIHSHHWQRDRILAAAGQRVSLLFIGNEYASRRRDKRSRLFRWLEETGDVVSAAAYTEHAFFEELHKIASARSLDHSWLPQTDGKRFDYLFNLIVHMRVVLQAIFGVRNHIQRLGAGVLLGFARDLWRYDKPVSQPELLEVLGYVESWLVRASTVSDDHRIPELVQVIKEICMILPPFA